MHVQCARVRNLNLLLDLDDVIEGQSVSEVVLKWDGVRRLVSDRMNRGPVSGKEGLF